MTKILFSKWKFSLIPQFFGPHWIVFFSGQGHFGKVYTAINNETGDIMAMKEIPLQPNDHKTLK